MSIDDLKSELFLKIKSTHRPEILLKIKEMLDKENTISNVVNEASAIYKVAEKIRVFNEWEQNRVDLGLKQIEKKDFISQKDAQIEIEKWFKEQEK